MGITKPSLFVSPRASKMMSPGMDAPLPRVALTAQAADWLMYLTDWNSWRPSIPPSEPMPESL